MYFNFIQLSGICIYIWFKCYLSVFTVQSEWHICGSISSKLELVQRRLHRNHLSWSNDILSMWKYCTYNLYEWLMFLFSTRYLHSVNESLLGRVFFSSSMVDQKSTDTHITSYFTVGLRCNWLVFNAVFH